MPSARQNQTVQRSHDKAVSLLMVGVQFFHGNSKRMWSFKQKCFLELRQRHGKQAQNVDLKFKFLSL